jgi:hydrogenase maturation protein HypF
LDAGPVIGVALDGLGFGEGGELWGGEFAVADYTRFERHASFKPVALLGGEQAMREPWRNTYAHLVAAMGWPEFASRYEGLAVHKFLAAKPRALLDAMLTRHVNSPLASSCGRLFDAVAAALGLCRDRTAYEGQAAILLESCIDLDWLAHAQPSQGLPFAIERPVGGGLALIEPRPMWQALLDELTLGTPISIIAARFHLGLAQAIGALVDAVAHSQPRPLRHVALSGGVFQNAVLLHCTSRALRAAGYQVLSHHRVPCNDGGLALGQAVVAAARALQIQPMETSSCA